MKKVWDALHEVVRTVGISCYVVILFCITFQIILRFFFGKNTSWAEEVSQLCYIAVCFMGMSLVERENGHVRLDMVLEMFPKLRNVILDIGRFFTIIFALVVAYSEWLLRPAVAVVTTKASGIPLRYIHNIIFAFSILWAVDAAIGFVMSFTKHREEVNKMEGGEE